MAKFLVFSFKNWNASIISLGKDFRLIDGLNRSSKLRNEKLKEGYCLSSILLRWTANIL